MRTINKIILHCTDTPAGREHDIEDIRKWHVEGNGWSDVGYHFLIKINGDIETGRDLDVVGAHTKSQNKDSIGIAYVGGRNEKGDAEDTMTLKQNLSMIRLINSLKTIFGNLEICGHNEFSTKACPSFKVKQKYQFLID